MTILKKSHCICLHGFLSEQENNFLYLISGYHSVLNHKNTGGPINEQRRRKQPSIRSSLWIGLYRCSHLFHFPGHKFLDWRAGIFEGDCMAGIFSLWGTWKIGCLIYAGKSPEAGSVGHPGKQANNWASSLLGPLRAMPPTIIYGLEPAIPARKRVVSRVSWWDRMV